MIDEVKELYYQLRKDELFKDFPAVKVMDYAFQIVTLEKEKSALHGIETSITYLG